MSKHTPGPWTSDPDHIIGRIHALEIGMPIADCHGYVGFSQSLANARLIAAAPDLLEALEHVEAMLTGDSSEDIDYRMVVKAIARAKG